MKSLLYFLFLVFLVINISGCGKSSKTSDYENMVTEENLDARIMDLNEKIEDEPNNLEWRFQLAKAYEQKGNDMQALRTYEEALAMDPNRADLKYAYAETAIRLGDKRKAYNAYIDILEGVDSDQYLSRIASKFVDAYEVTAVINSELNEAFPYYSADGSKIVYQAYADENWDLFEYDMATQQTTKITTYPSEEELPSLSPDGNTVVYTSTMEDHRDVNFHEKLRDIYIKNLTTKLEQNLTVNNSNDWSPRFSTDGKFIVFVSERDDTREVDFLEKYGEIYIMEKNGSFQIRLTNNEARDGNPWLVGGEHGTIYFDSDRNGKYGIFKMKTDGSQQKLLTTNLEWNDVAPVVSADGSKILFFSDRDGNYELYMMNIDGSNQQRLTSNISDDTNPVFSPDGTRVLFHSNRTGNYDIFELDLTKTMSTPSGYEVTQKINEALQALN